MAFLLKLLEFLLGAACIIGWVTVLGVIYSKFAPEKLIKKKTELIDCIAISGIGLFCTLLTLFFFFIAPKIGLARVEISSLFGSMLSGGEMGLLHKWLSRIIIVTLGVFGSYLYVRYFFSKAKLKPIAKGLIFGVLIFLLGTLIIFPAVSIAPGVQLMDLSVPALFGSMPTNLGVILTFLSAMIVFGSLMAHIYNQWEEA